MGRNVMAWLRALLLVLFAAPAALAGGFEVDSPLTTTPGDIVVSAAAVDTSTFGAPSDNTNAGKIAVNGNPTLYVVPRYATLASVTATLQVEGYYPDGTAVLIYSGAITFSSTSNGGENTAGGGRYPTTTGRLAFGTSSFVSLDVKITAIDVSGASVVFKRHVGTAQPGAEAAQ